MRKFLVATSLILASVSKVFAQDDTDSMMKMLDEEDEGKIKKKEVVSFTFKTTRLINGSTTESLGAGVLDMRISHRFGTLDQGIKNFYGIDDARTRIGLDYGITRNLMVGIGHNVLDKENDVFAKYAILRQQKDGTPVSVSYLAGMSIQTQAAPSLPSASYEWMFANRLSYFHQLLVARKFSERLSLMLMPSLLHCNIVESSTYTNNYIALGVGGRVKLSKRVAFTGEYYYRLTGMDNNFNGTTKTYNSLSLGFDIETGGHVFQLHLTNSQGVSERIMLGRTTDTWSKGQMRYGFNISRVFTIVKPKEFKRKD